MTELGKGIDGRQVPTQVYGRGGQDDDKIV